MSNSKPQNRSPMLINGTNGVIWIRYPDEEEHPIMLGRGTVYELPEGYVGEFTIIGTPAESAAAPIPMLLWCPGCSERHIDEGDFASRAHHTHACQSCGLVWRPAIVATVGVRFLPGFKNLAPTKPEGDEHG